MAHCRQLPKIEPFGFFFFLFFPFSSSAVREKGEVSQRKLHCGTEGSERQREPSRDEPRRVFEKAALLSEGGMAMEYGLPFQEGRMRWRGEWMDGWMDLVNTGPVACTFLVRSFIACCFLCDRTVSLVSFADFYQPPTSFCPSSLPPSLPCSFSDG